MFKTLEKGENYELKVELNSGFRDKRKEAVKKVIANMTVGKDVSGLFADVVKNMQTEDLELKKLVYLYLINYAKSQPELVILAVNTFVKDSDDRNPLIRALAIRTMGCIRVEKITAYILEPLKKGLEDSDPYVRKTAALCVAKFYDLNPNVATDAGIVVTLQEMLGDKNPMVIANVVTALMEINEKSNGVFVVDSIVLAKLLAAINECTEWGQVCILDSLANYKPINEREAEDIVEKVIPRLQHANASVVLAAVKVTLVYYDILSQGEILTSVNKKLAPSLGIFSYLNTVTLLASEPEVQYVVLRNIGIILQKRPHVLSKEIRVFFTKYNDPPYVKLEKLDIILKLSNEENIDQVLSELKEYASEVDVEFGRKSVKTIGRCAIKIESAADKCVQVLLDLIKSKVSHVVQEAIVVTCDIFRKYPYHYEGIISILCENLEALDSAEARAAIIWIIGEYAGRIDNASELLEYFLETFKEERANVQLQLITATAKLFLNKPGEAQELVQRVLNMATQNNENPDIRDRAYVYWRLLSSSPQAAKAVVLAEKMPIHMDTKAVNDCLLDEMVNNLSNLASVYYKPVSLVTRKSDEMAAANDYEDGEPERPIQAVVQDAVKALGGDVGNLLDLDFGTSNSQTLANVDPSHAKRESNIDDMLGSVDGDSLSMPFSFSGSPSSGPIPSGSPASGVMPNPYSLVPGFSFPKTIFLSSSDCKGLSLEGTFYRKLGTILMDMHFENQSSVPITDFAIQFNTNSFGLAPASPLSVSSPLLPKSSCDVQLPLSASRDIQLMDPYNALQVAIKCSSGIFYFQTLLPLHVLFDEGCLPSEYGFEQVWKSADAEALEFECDMNPNEIESRLIRNGIMPLPGSSQDKIRMIATNKIFIITAELVKKSETQAFLTVKSTTLSVLPLFQESIKGILA